ncbi:MAG: hypothetical protein JOZ62_04090 [Acidobacteriaceae bacterium]|nr:hypothetical protein [Acidobacteriaceae bacterium]
MPRLSLQHAPLILLASALGGASGLFGQVILSANGVTDTYRHIEDVLASGPETPDCSHPEFGPHITQAVDDYLGKYAFVFNIHVYPDNDRCINFDRQRVEIKTEGNSSTPDYLKGFLNDTVTFRWKFKLPAGFQPATSFTHIHQIKPYDGDAANPIITLTPRKGSSGAVDSLQLIHIDSMGVTTVRSSTELSPFLGTWVEAYENITYSSQGQYSIVINRLSDGETLFSYSNDNLDLWRNGTTVVRPKWGIYRSLTHPDQLADEQVLFDRFCLAKGTDDCLSDEELPDFSVRAFSSANAIPPGATERYGIRVSTVRGFNDSVALSVTGLPDGATAEFCPDSITGGSGHSILRVHTSETTPTGAYSLVISGISGALSHVAVVQLVIE